MQMSQIVQTFRLRLHGERPSMYTELVLTAGSKPHRRMWKSLLMDKAERRMKAVTEKSTYINDTPLLCSSVTVQA